MMTLEEIYKEDPTQKIIDEGADYAAKEMLKAGIPIFYRSEEYPETMDGNFFVKEFSTGAKFLVRFELTEDYRLLEENIRSLNGW